MKEDLRSLINQEFEKMNPSESDKVNLQETINDIVKKSNEKARNNIEYRRKLFEVLEKLEKMNIKLDYNDKMTNEELEKIIKEVKI